VVACLSGFLFDNRNPIVLLLFRFCGVWVALRSIAATFTAYSLGDNDGNLVTCFCVALGFVFVFDLLDCCLCGLIVLFSHVVARAWLLFDSFGFK
jgi:uncharacterized membrane protein HdeD (DUF308 family)